MEKCGSANHRGKMEKKLKYIVYKILIDKKTRYIGHTNDLLRREKQHNYLCFRTKNKKILYNKIKTLYPEYGDLSLIEIKGFNTKIEAKRYECFLILTDYFGDKELWQQIPKISDM